MVTMVTLSISLTAMRGKFSPFRGISQGLLSSLSVGSLEVQTSDSTPPFRLKPPALPGSPGLPPWLSSPPAASLPAGSLHCFMSLSPPAGVSSHSACSFWSLKIDLRIPPDLGDSHCISRAERQTQGGGYRGPEPPQVKFLCSSYRVPGNLRILKIEM